MSRHVVFFEVPGGSDKGPDGHRRDTMPMIESVKAKGWTAEVVFYTDENRSEIFEAVKEKADAYVSRVNPGNIPGGERAYLDMLRDLCDAGVVGLPHPDAMLGFGAKDSLVKLTDTDLVPDDTKAYYSMDELRSTFPKMLSLRERVLKQNRGSTGEGIWRVVINDERSFKPGDPPPPGHEDQVHGGRGQPRRAQRARVLHGLLRAVHRR